MTTEDIRRAETPENLERWIEPDVYKIWQEREGVPVIVDFAFEDMGTVELGPWKRKGGKGAIINIPNRQLLNDCHLVEIAAGGKSEPEHHMYEETMYVVSGRGATSVWLDENHKSTFEWHDGSLVSIPLNAWYQHFNGSGTEPARYLSVTNAPPVMRQWRDLDFIFGDTHQFKSRFGGDNEDYFSGAGAAYQGRKWVSNFIPSAPNLPLYDYKTRGAGGIQAHIEMAGNVNRAHISEFPLGTYKKAHRHGPGAHLVILSGQGFSLLWNKEDRSDMRKADWHVGSMVVVPADATFHQHFNTGTNRARYLALRPGNGGGGEGGGAGEGGAWQVGSDLSIEEGGWQIEYGNEAKEIHDIFEAELAKNGATCRMKAFVPYCNGEMGPTDERRA